MGFSRARLWPPGTSRFKALAWVAVIGLVLMALLVPVSPALSNDTLGNNGTVKIHEGEGENDPGEVRNEPHVCTFHLHFYFSDPEQAGTWEIQEWSPGDKGTVVLSGTYDTQGDGEDREPDQGVYTLEPGHYKLFWDGDLDTEKHDKMKVFWVDCETSTSSTSESSSASETTSSSSASETTSSSSASETTSSSSSASETTSSSASETTSSSSSASETTSSSASETTSSSSSASETSTASETTSTSSSGSQTVSGTSTSSTPSQVVSGTTTSPTQPNTSTIGDSGSNNSGSAIWLLIAVLGGLLGSVLVLAPARAKKRD